MIDSERLKTVLDYLKLSVAKLAKELGYERPQKIYNVTQGINGISTELAKDITDKYREINFEWLRYGKGSMLNQTLGKSTSEKQEQVSLMSDYISIPREVLDMIRSMTETIQSQQRTIELLERQNKKTNVPPEGNAGCAAVG